MAGMSPPARYRKLVIERLTGDFRTSTAIVETPWMDPGPGQVAIRNRYAGCNAVFDQNLCRNTVQYVTVAPPFDLGIEAVGEIVAIGPGVSGFEIGDRVVTSKLGNGYREYQVAHARRVIQVRTASPEIVTLIPTGVSALVALEQVAELKSGETVIVSAAAGGLGHMVVQLAKLAGNHVIGVTSSDAKRALLEEIGCDRVINHRAEDLRGVLAREYPKGVDVAYDSVGGEIFDAFLDHLAIHGRLIISGHTSDFDKPDEPVPQSRLYRKLYWKSASVRAFLNPQFPEFFDDAARRILELHASGKLRALVDPTPFRGLESACDAVEHLLSGKNCGKVVIEI
jgi:NADPH-dependent curcumin reductase CurA